MYCQNCGSANDASASFCVTCGNKLAALPKTITHNPVDSKTVDPPTPIVPAGRIETIVIEIDKQDEAATINDYRFLGWELVNNQEVNVTSVSASSSTNAYGSYASVSSSTETYVKLTFERNIGRKNFDILNRYYQHYLNLKNERDRLRSEIKAANKLPTKLMYILSGIFAIPILPFSLKLLMIDPEFNGVGLNIMIIILCILMSYLCGMLLALIPCAIIASNRSKATKERNLPQIEKLQGQMRAIAVEASNYL